MGADVTERAVLQAAERTNGSHDPTLVELSTGVVLRVKKVPRQVFADIVADIKAPAVPVAYIPDKGREEENPDDPDYLDKYRTYQARLAKAMSDAVTLLGTDVESVPDGFPTDTDRDWLDEMRALGHDLSNPKARYLAWVKYKAAVDEDDFNRIWKGVGRLSGVTETDTADELQRFPRGTKRRADRSRQRADS